MRRTLAALAACIVAGAAQPGAGAASTMPGHGAVMRRGACYATITALSFAAYSPSSNAGRVARAYVTFDCATPVADIELSAGASGDFRNRRMAAAGNSKADLSYNMYLDAAHTRVFGDGSGGSSAYVPAPNTSQGTFTVYGEITDGQTMLRAASYSDSTTLTVTLVP